MIEMETVIEELKKKYDDLEYREYTNNNIKQSYIILGHDSLQTALDINISTIISNLPAYTKVEDVVKIVNEMYEEYVNEDTKISTDKDYVLENIRSALRKTNSDYAITKNTPYKGIQQFLCIYDRSYNQTLGLWSTNKNIVTPKLLNTHNISEAEAWEYAIRNNRNNVVIQAREEVLRNSLFRTEYDKATATKEPIEIYLVTNDKSYYGAASILETDILKERLQNYSENTEWEVSFVSGHKAILIPKHPNDATRTALEMVERGQNKFLSISDEIIDQTFTLVL